jgi:hypothetical protein
MRSLPRLLRLLRSLSISSISGVSLRLKTSETVARSVLRRLLDVGRPEASLVVDRFEYDPSWHKPGMDYWITFDVGLFAEAGLRKLEDYLLVVAAFQAAYPDVEPPC